MKKLILIIALVVFSAGNAFASVNGPGDKVEKEKEFMLIFRSAPPATKPTPAQMQASIKQWQDWIGTLAKSGKFKATNRLGFQASVINTGKNVAKGPYLNGKEAVGGYMIITASSMEEALDLAKDCPILLVGGNVEVRDIMVIGQ